MSMLQRSKAKQAYILEKSRAKARAFVNSPRKMTPTLRKIRSFLRARGAFESLEAIKMPTLRLLHIDGKTFVLKHTLGNELHGKKFEEIRASIFAHQRAVRIKKITPKNYVLRSIKVLARIGNILVMPYVEGENVARLLMKYNSNKLPEGVSLGAAYAELGKNMDQLYYEYLETPSCEGMGSINALRAYPQLKDIIVQNTKPNNPLKGKWIFYATNDLG